MTIAGSITKKLFPHTPIQIVFELEKWAVYVEGQWYCNREDKPTAFLIDYIIKRHSDDWLYPSTRINPDWIGWKQIKEYDLVICQQIEDRGCPLR